MAIFLTLFTYLFGALPFSVWIGRFLLNVDIREFGDGNPGATNVLRAGGAAPFALAMALDISKGAFPVGLSYYILGLQDWRIVPISLAASLGHSVSPFLGWRGGKAIATTFGVMIGFSLWRIPLVAIPAITVMALLLRPHGWAVMLSMAIVLLALLLLWPMPVWIAVWVGQLVLLAYTHWPDLRQRPELRRKAT